MNRPTLAALILLPIALAFNVVADFPPQGGIAGEALSRLGHAAANVLAYISLALVVWGSALRLANEAQKLLHHAEDTEMNSLKEPRFILGLSQIPENPPRQRDPDD